MKRLFLLLLLASLGLRAENGPWEKEVAKAARLHKKGQLKAAEAVLLNSLLTAEQFGKDDPRLAYTLDYLGTLNMQMNQPDKASPMLERAVKAFADARGNTAPETIESMGRLAESYDQRSLFAKSEPLYRQIVAAQRGDAMLQSADINSLAVSVDAQGRQDEALGLYRQALEIREKNFGPEGAELPEILNNMARVYYMKGDFKGAEPLYLRAIGIDEAMLKPDDPQLADDYLRMAALCKKTSRESLAADYEARAAKVKALVPPAPKKKKSKP